MLAMGLYVTTFPHTAPVTKKDVSMKRSTTLAVLLTLMAPALILAAPEAQHNVKPNIVLLFVDDLGWSDLGYRNSDVFETPHIDQLAAQGTDFQQAYIAAQPVAPVAARY